MKLVGHHILRRTGSCYNVIRLILTISICCGYDLLLSGNMEKAIILTTFLCTAIDIWSGIIRGQIVRGYYLVWHWIDRWSNAQLHNNDLIIETYHIFVNLTTHVYWQGVHLRAYESPRILISITGVADKTSRYYRTTVRLVLFSLNASLAQSTTLAITKYA
jgi:hypothetical protein